MCWFVRSPAKQLHSYISRQIETLEHASVILSMPS